MIQPNHQDIAEARLRTGEIEPIGRDAELAFLTELLADTEDGLGGLAVLSGGGGLGKSTLARSLLRRAEAAGFQVAMASIEPGARARLPWPWPRLLRGLQTADADALRRELSRERIAAQRSEGFLAGAGLEPGRIATQLVDVLSEAALQAPLLLALDDAHWMDGASAETLRLVAEAAEDLPVLLLAIGRDEEPGDSSSTMGALKREASTRTLELVAMGKTEISQVAGRELTLQLGGEDVVASLTRGNPLLATELRRAGELDADRLQPGDSLEASLGRLARARLETLPAPVRRCLEAVVLEPGPVDPGLLAEACDMPLDRVEEALAEPALAGLVETAQDRTVGKVELSHELIRDAIAQTIGPGDRRALHAGFAEAFERRQGHNLGISTSSLAYHACRGVPAVAGARAAEWARRAAAEAIDNEAWDPALAWVEAGLQALALAAENGHEALQAGLIAEGLAAEVANPEKARSRLDTLAQLGEHLDPADTLELFVRIADTERGRSDDPGLLASLLAHIEDVLRGLPADLTDRVALEARRLWFLHRLPEDSARAECEEISPEVLAASAAPGVARRHRETALATFLLCNVFAKTPTERLELARELEGQDGDLPNSGLLLVSSTFRVVDSLAAGLPGDADRAIDQLSRQVAMSSHHPASWYPFHLRAMRAAMRGDTTAARRLLETGMENAGENYFDAASSAIVLLAQLCEIRGLPVEEIPAIPHLAIPVDEPGVPAPPESPGSDPLARPWSEEVQRVANEAVAAGLSGSLTMASRVPIGSAPDLSGHWQAGYAKILVHTLGQPETARDILENLARNGFRDIPRDAQWIASICLLAETCFDLRLEKTAGALLELLAPFEDRIAMAIIGLACGGAVAGYAAPLAWLKGDVARFEELSDKAIEINDRAGATYFGARVRLERARLLSHLGEERLEDVQRFAQDGGTIVEAAGLKGLEPLCRELAIAPLPEKATSAPAALPGMTSQPTDAVFERHGDIWKFRWQAEEAQLRHQLGFDCIRTLLLNPHENVHCRDLMVDDPSASLGDPAGKAAVLAGDVTIEDEAGIETVDAQALSEYRRRIEEARGELAEAEANNDTGRQEILRQEIEAILEMVSSTTGLGGRRRKTLSSAERARTAVRKRIKGAMDRLRRELPGLHAHLAAHLQTGTICTYKPDTLPRWALGSR